MVLEAGKTKSVVVDKAERDALAQVLAKSSELGLVNYERDLLQQLLDKIDS